MPKKLTGSCINDEFIESLGSSRFQCTICRTNRNAPLELMRLSKVERHVKSKSHTTRAAHEQLRLLEAKHAQDALNIIPHPVPEPPPQIDSPPQHRGFDQHLIFPELQVTAPPLPPPEVEFSPPEVGDCSDAYNDSFLSDAAWAALNHDSHGHVVDPEAFLAPAGMFDGVHTAEEVVAGGPLRKNSPSANHSDYGPYMNREQYLTHSLFNAPHMRFSVAQQQAILDWAHKMRTPNVPSLYALSKCDEALKALAGDSSEETRNN